MRIEFLHLAHGCHKIYVIGIISYQQKNASDGYRGRKQNFLTSFSPSACFELHRRGFHKLFEGLPENWQAVSHPAWGVCLGAKQDGRE